MKKTALFSSVLFFTPLLALAQTLIPIRNLIAALNGVIIALVPLLIGAAVVAFFWGLLVYIFKSGKEGNKEGKKIRQLFGRWHNIDEHKNKEVSLIK